MLKFILEVPTKLEKLVQKMAVEIHGRKFNSDELECFFLCETGLYVLSMNGEDEAVVADAVQFVSAHIKKKASRAE